MIILFYSNYVYLAKLCYSFVNFAQEINHIVLYNSI